MPSTAELPTTKMSSGRPTRIRKINRQKFERFNLNITPCTHKPVTNNSDTLARPISYTPVSVPSTSVSSMSSTTSTTSNPASASSSLTSSSTAAPVSSATPSSVSPPSMPTAHSRTHNNAAKINSTVPLPLPLPFPLLPPLPLPQAGRSTSPLASLPPHPPPPPSMNGYCGPVYPANPFGNLDMSKVSIRAGFQPSPIWLFYYSLYINYTSKQLKYQ